MRITFQDIKGLFQGLHDANVELIKGIGDEITVFKVEMKDLIKEYNPVIGDAIEKIDRAKKTTQNTIDGLNPIQALKREFKSEQELYLADHLCVQRIGYTHHGLYIDNGYVLHYSDGCITIDNLDDFKGVSTINVVNSPITYPREDVISRGYSKLGNSSYNLIFNNCEHFVRWCRSGGKTSDSI